MNQMLEQRIANLMGDTEPMPMMMRMGGEVDAMPTADQAVEQLLMARQEAADPTEQAQADKMVQAADIAAESPLAELAAQIAAAGRGPDTTLAHLTPGEVVLPPEMMESEQFETAVENRFRELDLNPEQYVVGMGIASLNPQTGLEEFGFFKKLGKSIKKLAKKIAPVAGPLANFIPGVGPIVAGAIGAATNVVGGKGLKGALSGALGGYGTGKLLGGIGSLGGAGAGAGAGGTGATSGGFFSKVGEFILPGQDKVGLIGNIGKGIGSLFGVGGQSPAEILMAQAEGNPALTEQIRGLVSQGYGPDEILQMVGGSQGSNPLMQAVNYVTGQSGPTFGSDPYTQSLLDRERQAANIQGGIGSFLSGLIRGGGIDDKGNFGLLGDILGGAVRGGGIDDKGNFGYLGDLLGGAKSFLGTDTGKMVGAGGIAALLGKLAYDEAKNRRGVPRTPLTTMDAMGRFNIEQEIAKRMGKGDVDPREFGLMSRDTIPMLSGGRKRPERDEDIRYTSADRLNQVPQTMMNGGMVMPMRYAEGGGVEMEQFKAMDGKINGPGTETSDDIPAMLSDGEFVMKAQAVRGAGAFDLSKGDGGIITLKPNGKESRERGTQIMYQMMDMFSNQARAS